MFNGKKVIAIIPARGGSKRVPRKNLRQINGKSLLDRTIDTAKQSRFIDRIVVSSEDAEIITAAKKAGADVPFVRPAELAQDTSPGVDPILHAVENLPGYDYLVLLQVTTPLRTVSDIDDCIQFCLEQDAPVCVSVKEVSENPYWMFKIKDDNKLAPVMVEAAPSRSQDLPVITILNGALYVAKTDWFLENKTFLCAETIGFKMSREKSLDIDTEEDWKEYENYLKRNIIPARITEHDSSGCV
jgi:CMP-N,N'-diacetyllegionaminic acid synthase